MALKPKVDEKKGDDKSTDDKIEGLTKAFGDMSKNMADLPNQIGASVTRSITGLVEKGRADQMAAKSDNDEDETPMPSGSDLEKFSRTEFANHIMGQIEKALDKKLKPFQESISSTVESNEREKVTTKFEAARKDYKDFDEWQPEMTELIKTRGYLDPGELYTLVRAKDPDKAKEIDEKLSSQQADDDKQKQEKTASELLSGEKPTFLGLMPTSGASNEGEPKYENAKEAASAAFDEIMGGIPENLIGENSQT